jgi:hypothetical protein
MGITPDSSVLTRKPSLKTAALAVIATLRMAKQAQGWAVNRKLHAQLVQKLQAMRRGNAKLQQ